MKRFGLVVVVMWLVSVVCAQVPMKDNPIVFQRSGSSDYAEYPAVVRAIHNLVQDDAVAMGKAVLLNFRTTTHEFYEVATADHNHSWLLNSDGKIIASAEKLTYYDRVIVAEYDSANVRWYEIVNYEGERFCHCVDCQNLDGCRFDHVSYITGSKGPYLVLKPYKGTKYLLVTPNFRRIGLWYDTVKDAQAEWEREDGR
ncbi:MAG: hypothetical protein J5719_02750 [Bacteroidales bacterium]|nr:hypothetical protein [Bacteroidales bacterium]